MTKFKIGNLDFNQSSRTYVIAELSANHNQNLDVALQSVIAAKNCGVDAIKLQTYRADTITLDCDNEYFQVKHGTIWDGQTLYSLYQQAFTPWEWHEKIFAMAKDQGIDCFSSPFDPSSVEFLEKLNPPAYKIASPEIVDIPLIQKIAKLKKPMIISTGIAYMEDIERAVAACHAEGNEQIALLKCTSAYPAPMEDSNLLTINTLREKFGKVIGLSDHTMGSDGPIAAVALGARIVEKHFIIDRAVGGPDASFSMNPAEFTQMVQSIRNVEKALGSSHYELTEKAISTRAFMRSLFIVEDVAAGETLTEKNCRSIRPGQGLAPRFLPEVLGKKLAVAVKRGTPLKLEMLN
jgi:pseudaminic acid synthase